jgi:hypothetical protein
MNKTKFAAVFIAVQAVSAFIAWSSGYNFDYRSSDVGFWVGMSIAIGLMFGAAAGAE